MYGATRVGRRAGPFRGGLGAAPRASVAEYEYNNPRNVTSSCGDWLNYPNRTGATATINCNAWGCDERLYHIWRAQHLPHVAGIAADGSSNNWWTYILSR